jgi:hypothetical protein
MALSDLEREKVEQALAEAKRVRRVASICVTTLARLLDGEYSEVTPTAQGGTRNEYGNSTRDHNS